MAECKAKVILSNEVHRKIEWFTRNFDKEIGAVGTGKIKKEEDGEKYFYIDGLHFPKQDVTGSTVHFTAEMWGSLIKDKKFLERMGDVCFYWHSHPGNAAHSQTDEEDTFETFMGKEANRQWFVFLQTAEKTSGELDMECRVDLRTPIRVTVLDKDIELEYELPPKDAALETECEKIIETCVLKPKPTVVSENKDARAWNQKWKQDWNYNRNLKKQERLEAVIEKNDPTQVITIGKDTIYVDNDFIKGHATSVEEKASLKFENGQATVRAGKIFRKAMENALNKGGCLTKIVRQHKTTEGEHFKIYHLQPAKKCFIDLQKKLVKLFSQYNMLLYTKMTDTKKKVEAKDDGKSYLIKDDEYKMQMIVGDLMTSYDITWKNNDATVHEYGKAGALVGSIFSDDDFSHLKFTGKILVDAVKRVEYYLEHEGVLEESEEE